MTGRARRADGGTRDDGPLPVTVVLEDPRLPYPYQEGGVFNELDRADQLRVRLSLRRLPGYRFEFLDRHESLASDLAARRPAFVLNLCDTGFRNRGELEAHVPALLEMLDIPYSGAAPEALAVCRDKALVRAVAAEMGVPVPAERYLDGGGEDRLGDGFPYPALVKPNLEEGSRGITAAAVVDGPPAAARRIAALRRDLPGSPLLLQEFLGGGEVSVGLVGNPATGLRQLPLLEVDYDGLDADLPPILAFEYKNDPASRYARLAYRRPGLPPATAEELGRHSRRLFARLGCRDYARLDFRAGADGRPRLLEVNPNPAWVLDSCMHKMAQAEGRDYPGFLQLLLEAALDRHGLGADRPGS